MQRNSNTRLNITEGPRRPGDAARVVAATDRIRATLDWTPRHDDLNVIVRSALDVLPSEQAEVLDRAAALVRPGGRIAYVTCSVLGEENGAQARAFLDRHAGFAVVPPEQVAGALWDKADDFLAATRPSPEGLLMTPHRTGTDGFFVSILHRTA